MQVKVTIPVTASRLGQYDRVEKAVFEYEVTRMTLPGTDREIVTLSSGHGDAVEFSTTELMQALCVLRAGVGGTADRDVLDMD